MPRKPKKNKKSKSPKEKRIDAAAAKALLKSLPRKSIKGKAVQTGTMIVFKYTAKDKTMIYDKTPCAIILWRTKTHTLGINLHWAPLGLRERIVQYIHDLNKSNIQNNKPLEITYEQMKPFLKQSGSIPIIRLYINNRMSSHGVIVPTDKMKIASRYSNEDFSVPKAEKLYKKAVIDYRKKRKTTKNTKNKRRK